MLSTLSVDLRSDEVDCDFIATHGKLSTAMQYVTCVDDDATQPHRPRRLPMTSSCAPAACRLDVFAPSGPTNGRRTRWKKRHNYPELATHERGGFTFAGRHRRWRDRLDFIGGLGVELKRHRRERQPLRGLGRFSCAGLMVTVSWRCWRAIAADFSRSRVTRFTKSLESFVRASARISLDWFHFWKSTNSLGHVGLGGAGL